MKESGVCHQNGNRKWRSEGSILRQAVQVMLILIVCFWLLYQIRQIHTRDCGCDETESQLRNKRIGKLLGRKGGLRYDSEVKALYDVDSNGGDEEGVKHEAEDNEGSDARGQNEGSIVGEEEDKVRVGKNPWRNFGEFLTKEGEIGEKLQEIKENTSTEDDEDEKIVGINKTKEEPLINVGAVILKKSEKKLEVSRLNGDDGVSRHDSGPSRRNNMQIDTSGKANELRSGNLSKETDDCQKLCSKKMAQKKSSVKSEGKAVDEGMKDMAIFESGHAGMRELLNIDNYVRVQ